MSEGEAQGEGCRKGEAQGEVRVREGEAQGEVRHLLGEHDPAHGQRDGQRPHDGRGRREHAAVVVVPLAEPLQSKRRPAVAHRRLGEA